MTSGIAGSRDSIVIIRNRSCSPQRLALPSSALPSSSGGLSLGGFRKAYGHARFRDHSLSILSGQRPSLSQVSQHKSKKHIPLLRFGSGQLTTLVRRCKTVKGQVRRKPIRGSRGLDSNPHLSLLRNKFSFPDKVSSRSSRAPGQVDSRSSGPAVNPAPREVLGEKF